ncbi:MAG: hypothetical protein WDN44_01860 [Sphingomonas sp.]
MELVLEPQRRRLESLFALGPKRRGEAVGRLDHAVSLDPGRSRLLKGVDTTAPRIAALLREAGAPAECFVIGGGAADGKTLALDAALAAVVGGGNGVFVSCIPGKLGYFESEERGSGRLAGG